MAEGFVKWFISEKGYGMITPYDGGPDVFVHYSTIQMTGYKYFDGGERVSFDLVHGTKGPHASRVEPLGDFEPYPLAKAAQITAATAHRRTKPDPDWVARAWIIGIPALIVIMLASMILAMTVALGWIWVCAAAMLTIAALSLFH